MELYHCRINPQLPQGLLYISVFEAIDKGVIHGSDNSIEQGDGFAENWHLASKGQRRLRSRSHKTRSQPLDERNKQRRLSLPTSHGRYMQDCEKNLQRLRLVQMGLESPVLLDSCRPGWLAGDLSKRASAEASKSQKKYQSHCHHRSSSWIP